MQAAFLQFKHLSASAFAASSENPSDTSLKFLIRSDGGCSETLFLCGITRSPF
jgi:hypothetical protein